MPRHTSHHDHGSPEYNSWIAMKKRCNYSKHPRFSAYGGRGILVCERWNHSYSNFLADMGRKPSPRHTLDRIDSTKGYFKDNCRWATYREQSRNRRDTVTITFAEDCLSIPEWNRRHGFSKNVIHQRLRNGWPPDLAVSLPKFTKRSRYAVEGPHPIVMERRRDD